MRNNIASLFLTCCTAFIVLTAKAEDPAKQTISNQVKLLDERISVLMADRVGIKKEILSEKLTLLEDMLLEEEEDLLFPADELYGSNWDTRWVDPFRSDEHATFPDSCEIDCSTFILPLITGELKVTSKYGPRRRRMHRGIDLKVQIGDTIRAAFSGKVRIRNFERRGYGNYLVIRHPNGLETVYGHLSRFLVGVDDIVKAGDAIALGGNTGRSTGSHLHFETRFLGQALNPADIIDFENGVPHQDKYVFRNVKINGRNSNIYTSSENQLVYHRVKKGDTLGKVARLYGTTVGQLCKLNGLKTTATLRVGQALRCSVGGAPVKTSKAANEAKPKPAAAEPVKTAVEQGPITHQIRKGETLSTIAKRYGTTVARLCELNNINQTTILKLGRKLKCS